MAAAIGGKFHLGKKKEVMIFPEFFSIWQFKDSH